MILKELTALVSVETSDVAETIFSCKPAQDIRLKSMFCPRVSIYSTWCRDISYLGLPVDSLVAEFEFLVQGDHEEEKIREYLDGFGVDVLEVWS